MTQPVERTIAKMLRELRTDPASVSLSKSVVVDKIVALRRNGLSYRSIANVLNEAGWSTLRGGGEWHASVVRSLLMQHGPAYLARDAAKDSFNAAAAERLNEVLAERGITK